MKDKASCLALALTCFASIAHAQDRGAINEILSRPVEDFSAQGQEARVVSLAELREEDVDMMTILIVGNAATAVRDGRMVTRRGYRT